MSRRPSTAGPSLPPAPKRAQPVGTATVFDQIVAQRFDSKNPGSRDAVVGEVAAMSKVINGTSVKSNEDAASLVLLVTSSSLYRESLLGLPDDKAQRVLDSLQSLLDSPPPNSPPTRITLRLLVHLSWRSSLLPSQLSLHNISLGASREPTRSGSSADVFLGTYRGHQVAIKQFRGLSAHDKGQLYPVLCREALIWRQLRHENVLRFIGNDAGNFLNSSLRCMVLPYISCGTLRDFIRTKNYVPLRDFGQMLYEIGCGLEYLHSENVVHGDLKDTNILIGDNNRPQIVDFGLSLIVETTIGRSKTMSSATGASRWLSPERLEADPGTKREPSGDVYAFGLLCVTMFARQIPFQRLNDFSIITAVLDGQRPDRDPAMPDGLWQLAQSCWAQAPDVRPSMTQVVESLRHIRDTTPRPANLPSAQGAGQARPLPPKTAGALNEKEGSCSHCPIQ